LKQDVVLLRRIVMKKSGEPTMLSQVHDTKSTSLTIPVPKISYTQAAAAIEKSKIQDAYFAGLIGWDQNRALKLLVTKCTEGWVPDKRALRHALRATLSTPAVDPITPLPSSGESTDSATVPANRSSYRHPEFPIEELKIEDAYVAGSITSDEKHDGCTLREPDRGQSLATRGIQMTEPPRPNNRVAGCFKSVQVAYSGMETYCIVPYRRTYRVEAISAGGAHRVLDVWSTEEAAVSQLRTLQIRAERADRRNNHSAKDWRG
jgi:hypothetical protein